MYEICPITKTECASCGLLGEQKRCCRAKEVSGKFELMKSCPMQAKEYLTIAGLAQKQRQPKKSKNYK